MAGMNVTGTATVNGYCSRPVEIAVTAVCQQDVRKTSNYEIKVPFSQMSQVMQSINRMGGKISGVSVTNFESVITSEDD